MRLAYCTSSEHPGALLRCPQLQLILLVFNTFYFQQIKEEEEEDMK